MAVIRTRWIFLLLCVAIAIAIDDVDIVASNSILIKALREMTNQTDADTLNLPANATSIRENITDTFSCENRTYGYYADVDNDCQVFHVCLPSQTPAGRNVTYRWSFICPKETIFNQEVLTCTRPRDSIDCKDSEMFYHLNAEIGKVPEKTEETDKKTDKKDSRKTQNRKNVKKQNIVIDLNQVDDDIKEKFEEFNLKSGVNSPLLLETVMESYPEEEDDDMDRIVMERNVRNERQMRRGAFRFRSDA